MFQVDKPDKTVYCPVTSQPLKFKDMIEVKFTLLDEETDETKSDTVYIAGKPKGNIKILNLAFSIVSSLFYFYLNISTTYHDFYSSQEMSRRNLLSPRRNAINAP